MRAWQFSKPKGPAFGISKSYYLSVLAPGGTLPRPLEIVHPKGDGGAATGFIAPLSAGTSKDNLQLPMERGTYVVASKDRKTVIRLMLMRAEESGVDPSQLASAAQLSFIPEWLFQLTFESHDVAVVPAIEFLFEVVNRLGLLVHGAVADPLCQRYIEPSAIYVQPRRKDVVNAPEHIVILKRPYAAGLSWITLGMQKFAVPEFELHTLDTASAAVIQPVLAGAAQSVFDGRKFSDGMLIQLAGANIRVRTGGHDPAWHGIPVWELEVLG